MLREVATARSIGRLYGMGQTVQRPLPGNSWTVAESVTPNVVKKSIAEADTWLMR